MHLPIAHLSGFEEDTNEELQAQLQGGGAQSGSTQEEEGSRDSESRGSGRQRRRSGKGRGSGDDVDRGGESEEGVAVVGKPPKDLPCPRCQSMNTKFCYYNNYSVNQPRHFCRNCQRYWTVGGTLRNVPVGGGSRKKPSRSRVRADPNYVVRSPGADVELPVHDESDIGRHGQHILAMAGLAHTHAGYLDFPFHESQVSSLLQLALQGQEQSCNNHLAGLMQLPPFLDARGFAPSAEEEAEMQAFYDAASQSRMMSTAAAMMGSGLWVPELEPAHVALVHKAALWAEAQRLQSMARQAQAAACADQELECKAPVASPPPVISRQQRAPNLELEAGVQHKHGASSLHRRPGFWEIALMHSRQSKRPAEVTPQNPPPPWTHEPDTNVDTLSHNVTMVDGAAERAAYSYEFVQPSSSWANNIAPSNSSNPENLSPFY